ncbi:serine/threonine-protein kinase [Serinicoccus kebangsaanensis]|uniref:serine/threonine-protein kinase n=1 Tax=Serinicoccus kebangsaanensis TaxID=2602069 RepID=UPI00178C464D|nr:serine/threonine-protein kinase [Serinicoccus kebangsaanensis]
MTTDLPRADDARRDATRAVPATGRGVAVGTEETEAVPMVVPRTLGPWTLRERIGEGGMGVVWRAEDERGRVVAIKVLRPHIAHDEGARARLRREVSTLARVHHPQVAAVIDADVDGPAPYIVTEYVPGRPLDVVIEERGALGREALLRLARGLAGALQAIHALGIVHRDLKPGNVLLDGEGDRLDPVVIDFGIAQVADDVRLTSTGLVMGTPGYLSPELVDGGEITEATDWWGWAACLAYAASGHPPFGRGPMTVVLDRVVRGRVQLDGVDPELAPLLATALSPRPSWRPSAEEVLEAVELYARGEDVTGALPRPPQEPVERGVDATQVTPQVSHTREAPRRAPDPTRSTPAGPRTRQWQQPARGAAPQPLVQPREPQQWPQSPDQQRTTAGPGARAQGWAGPSHQPGPRAEAARPETGGQQAYPGQGAPGPADPEQGQPDPRIGRSARSGTLAAMLLGFSAVAAAAPLLAWGLYAAWGLTTRTVDRTLTGLVVRRHEAGRRRSDVPLTVLASPWHLVAAALSTLLSLLLPLAVAAVVAMVVSGLLTTTELAPGVGIAHPVSMGLGSLVGGWLGWWGPASTSLRRGSRTLVRGTVPRGVPTLILITLCLVGGAALAYWSLLDGDVVSWWPLPGGTSPLDYLPFGLR